MENTSTQALRRRLRDLETELAHVYEALGRSTTETTLPGLFVQVEVGGFHALIPSATVVELVRLVAHTPVPNAPPYVLGTVLYRGRATWAVDLAAVLGVQRQPALDAHMVVLGTSLSLAVVVDRVNGLIEDPRVSDGALEEDARRFKDAQLLSALARVEERLVPVLALDRLVERVRGDVG